MSSYSTHPNESQRPDADPTTSTPRPDISDGRRQSSVTLSRRALFGSAIATAGSAAAVGLLGAQLVTQTPSQDKRPLVDDVVPAFGAHQAGIATHPQRHIVLVAADLSVRDAGALRRFFKDLTATIARITQGDEPPPSALFPADAAVPTDFATGLSPARLTVTVGVGQRIFSLPGLEAATPKRLRPLPAFRGDGLDPRWSDGDLLIQICADDVQVASAAMRSIRARMPGYASLRWTQSGFLSAPRGGGTPRNMFGQKDGTSNPRPGTADFAETVWARDDEPGWFTGGTYLVFRKIRMKTADWDLTSRKEQDAVIGRRRSDGSPLTGAREFDEPDFEATVGTSPVIAADAHIRRVQGFSMLRRSYSYDYGQLIATAGGSPDPTAPVLPHEHAPGTPEHAHGGHGSIDVGLLFCAYGNDPESQFIPAQRRMSQNDRLNRFITHTGSAMFAMLPGCAANGYLGDTLL
ncbi:dye decolorizing peroxidase/deferrochelatase/peroxidase EfeB [Microbacterium trichothecenolyticum]|uniref:Dyp-type peroxidase n=1 Tax=Microbacterium trichothecenolyticum TaxID=69370 RepID=UPI0028589330|nr:Dyp-type peroxidase [Microbacterium trichothecenolyticum]MDR7187172.1 dye decolorizing peroxidase/deferrochelatase/peroxidase EfeB [Microbacterium trichothecenolyticum]